MSRSRLSAFWQSYKYRFVPWLALNFKNRTARRVDGGQSGSKGVCGQTDKVVSDQEALAQVSALTRALIAEFSRPVGRPGVGSWLQNGGGQPQNGSAAPEIGSNKPHGSSKIFQKGTIERISHEFNNVESVSKNTKEAIGFANVPRSNKYWITDEPYVAGVGKETNKEHTTVSFDEKSATNNSNSFINYECEASLLKRMNESESVTMNNESPEPNDVCHHSHRLNNTAYSLRDDTDTAPVAPGMEDLEPSAGGVPESPASLRGLSPNTSSYEGLDAYERCLVPPPPSSAVYSRALQVTEAVLGFRVERRPSAVGGTGVVLTHVGVGDTLPRGRVVALYPGALYLPQQQAVMLQSFGNPFLFRCIDGILLDGHDRGLSRLLFRSSVGRDRVGPSPIADVTWLTDTPTNPLSVGQYVNNQSTEHPSNVAYQEVTLLPGDVSLEERGYLPCLWHQPPAHSPVDSVPLRLVLLVTTRDLRRGDELFSDYFTIVT